MEVENNVWLFTDILGLLILIPVLFCIFAFFAMSFVLGIIVLASFPLAFFAFFG
jgi:hypothetical protein